jgi:LysM repeat protein
MALNNFYNNEIKAGRISKSIAPNINPLIASKETKKIIKNYDSKKNVNRQEFEKTFDNLKDRNLEFYEKLISSRNKFNRGTYDNAYKNIYNLSPNDISRLEHEGIAKTKSGNDYQQYYRDIITPMQNLAAPFALVDRRIKPQREIEYSPIGVHNNYPGGSVKVYDYDPLAIKPYALRTKQEKIEWEKKYGKAKPQTNKPTPNTTVKQVITSETQEIPQQVIAEPVSVAEPRYQMRGDHSVFGPANSLLGLLDTKTNQFYPDYLNESARARVNQADSDLIANPEALAEYVRRLRDGITIVPKKQIGGWLNKYAEGGDIENPFLIGMGERPRAIKDNTRQVTNPSAEKYSRDAVLKRQFIDAKNFHNGWINSPMHKQMVKRSAGSKAEADIITKNRLSSLNKAQFSYYDHEHRKDPGIAGISNNATGNIALFSPAMNLLPSTMTHELSHSSDKEVDVEYGREIPIDDMNKISDYASKVFQQRQGERDKKGVDWFRYITQPTEVRARLNDIRRTGKEAEIYDPYVEKITPKKLDNLIELLYRQHDDTPGYNPYENLRDVYTNEQILDLLNSVSQNQNVPGNQPQVAARYGGGLYKMQPGGEKKEKGLLEEAWDTVTSWFSDEPAKPARREFPSDYKLKDPRKISATTGKPINPKRDLFSGSYSGNRMAELVTAAKRYGINPLDLLAVDLQETGWGNRSDAGAGHSLLSRSDLIPTKLPSEEEAMLDGADYFARSYKTKMNYADKLGIKDPALRIQVYNGLGKVVPETEQDYHGFKMQSIYGVPIPKGGIDMKKNPLYGKRIMDIRDNILSRDTALLNYIKEYSSGGQRSWLDRYDDGGEAIADVKYDVQRGDTLSKISSKYKVPLATLASANQLENPNLIVQGKQLNIPANPRKELTFEEIPTADNKKIIIDNFSKHYDYIVEKDKVYYKVKGGKTWADISDNKAAQENLFKFLDKNKYWAGYESGEQDLYSGTTTPRPTTIPEIPNMMSTANVPKAPRPNLTQKVDATGVKKPIAVPQVPTLGFSGNTNIPKAPRANLNQVADATFMRQPITGIPSKNQDDLIEQATSYLKSEVSKLNIKSKELQKDLGNTIEDIKHSVKSGVNKGVQTVEDLVETGLNGIKRKYATHTGADDDTVVPTSVNNKPKTVSEYYGNRTGAEITAVIDTPDKSGRQFKQQVLPVSSMKFGKRNRGEYNDITTEGLEVTTFHPFSSDRLPDNTSVIALDPNGKLHTGVYKDFKDKKGFTFSKTFRNNIVDFSETSGKNDYVSGKVSGNPSYNHPKIKVLNDAGKLVDGSLNILVKDDSKKDFYGSIQGGRVLFVNPDTKEQFLVSGSMSHIKDAFKKIKGNSKYLEAYTLDNGTYSRGLSYKDKKLTTDRLKSYDNENTGGGNGLYIVGYDQPVNRFKEELVEGMPNVRTEKDDSYKKGHALKNEIKNIVLHHTAYTSPNAEKEVKKQYMTPNQPSSHIVIERNGKRTVYASPEQVTFHAGESKWNNRSDVNDFSIGVEFQGDTNNQPLTQQQIESFVEYYVPIAKKYNLSLKDIITHEMVAPGRKPDVTQKEYKRILKYMKDNNIK